MSSIEIFISDVRIEVSCDREAVIAGLRAGWQGCAQPLLPTRRRVQLVVDQQRWLWCDGQRIAQADAEEDLLPLVEKVIYEAMVAWHSPALILHAACAARDGRALVLVGPSGSGKSGLICELLGRGGKTPEITYFSDDLTVFDGRQLWGVPRTPQFEPVAAEGTVPPFLAGCDLRSYRYRSAVGRCLTLPLWPVPPRALAEQPVPAARAELVFLERSTHGTQLECCTSLDALRRLHQALIGRPERSSPDLGALVHPQRCRQLVWRSAAAAVRSLEGLLGVGASA